MFFQSHPFKQKVYRPICLERAWGQRNIYKHPMFSIPTRSSVPCSRAKGSIKTDSWRVWGGRPSTYRLTQLDTGPGTFLAPWADRTWTWTAEFSGVMEIMLDCNDYCIYPRDQKQKCLESPQPTTPQPKKKCSYETWNSKPKKRKQCLMFQYTLDCWKVQCNWNIKCPRKKIPLPRSISSGPSNMLGPQAFIGSWEARSLRRWQGGSIF